MTNQTSILDIGQTKAKKQEYSESSNLYRHKVSGEYLRLLKKRKSNVNTFVQVDKNNKILLQKRTWTHKQDEQRIIIKGFDNLEKIV